MKDTEKALKEEFCQIFSGHGQGLSMMSKLILYIFKICATNYTQGH